jgi:multiple sugar transport system permease protein
MRYRIKKLTFRIFMYIVLPVFVLWIVFPFVWVVTSSFMTMKELGAVPPNWIPKEPTLQNYRSVIAGKLNLMAAAAVLTVIPPVVFVLILRKYIITGLTAGAVKG